MNFQSLDLSSFSSMESLASLQKEQWAPVVSIAAAAGLAVYALSTANKSNSATPKGYKEIPVAEGRLPYFGHLLSLGDVPALKITEMQQRHGPIMRIYMGVQPWVMISDPLIAHEIFMTKGSITSGRPFQLYTHNYYSINQRGVAFPNPGKRWKKTRTAALDILAPKNVDKFSPILHHEADFIVKHLLSATIANGHVEVIKPFQAAAMNVVLTTSLGKRATSLQDPLFQDIIGIVDQGMKWAGAAEDMSTFLPILTFLDVIHRKERRMKDFIEKRRNPLFRRLIKESLEGDAHCLVKSLYECKEEFDLDEDAILVTINDIIAAGADTIAVSLSWAMVILCHHPDVQQKLRDEVDAFIKVHNRLPNFDERDSLPYLISVQKECLRFRPTTPFGLLHEATEDLECRGYFIPQGTVLASNMYAMHWDPEVYPEPEKFIADRFMNNTKTMYASANSRIENRDHYNFGWGRRICPGIHLAEVQMYNVMVRVIARSVIAPVLDSKGSPVLPDLNGARDAGLVLQPPTDDVRFLERTDALI
ncbi:cytochrome P450 [Zychaea mexicana]|uniref:cytochrome P450 n=1 Tax=Zychaea mexicana TaxID=64656 RepID=UPI0022FE1FCE|nr:cytochrome P450 [Zychaea mexicana]KAI9491715.1 cytochrome P450 [Zychaea mexicana]